MKTMTDAELEQWNYFYPVGSPCLLHISGDVYWETNTRSEAWRVPDSDTVVVFVNDLTLRVNLDRVKMMETHKP